MSESLTAVTHDLRCIGCNAVLRGLPVTGQCPECGMFVMRTLVETLDMPSQALARPRHAARIARSVLLIGSGLVVWVVGVTAPAAGRGAVELFASVRIPSGSLPDQLGVLVAFIGALVLALGSHQLSRRDDQILLDETKRAGRWLTLGAGIWLVGAAGNVLFHLVDLQSWIHLKDEGCFFVCLSVQLVGGAVASIGLRTFLTVLGRRCRRYRQAGQAVQSMETMVAAGAIALVSSLASLVLPSLGWIDTALFARVIAFITGGLLLMGAIYLLTNFQWIARIIANPPPQLEDVIRVVAAPSRGEASN